MVLNKKGMVLTMVTITLLSIFAISYGAYSLIQDRSSINKRISTLNNFVASVEQDLPRQLFISGYRSVFLFNKKIIETGNYIDNTTESINEIFFNGTLDGETQDLMDSATFTYIQDFLTINAAKINAEITLLNPAIELTQDNPFNLKFTLNTTLIVTDTSGLASWNRSASIVSYVPLTNLEDPIYSVGTLGKATNKVNQTPYETFVSGADYTNLEDHFQNSYYKASASAPSYLQRLEGDFSSSPYGVESLVYPQDLTDAGINIKQKSLIDHIYFSNSDPQAYSVPAVNNLIIDNLADYDLTAPPATTI